MATVVKPPSGRRQYGTMGNLAASHLRSVLMRAVGQARRSCRRNADCGSGRQCFACPPNLSMSFALRHNNLFRSPLRSNLTVLDLKIARCSARPPLESSGKSGLTCVIQIERDLPNTETTLEVGLSKITPDMVHYLPKT